jgi:hypothetical protein
MEAMRRAKRRLTDVVYRQLVADAERAAPRATRKTPAPGAAAPHGGARAASTWSAQPDERR